MRPVNEELASRILEEGKRSFMEYGFQGASLRSIASAVGVTTGAIYKYYQDKESLFDALVEKPASELIDRYRSEQQKYASKELEDQLSDLDEISSGEYSWMIGHIYDNFDAFYLVICSSQGTRWEHYLDEFVEVETVSGRVLIDKMREKGMSVRDLDDDLIHILSGMLFEGMFEPVRHKMSREKAIAYTDDLREFYSAGWFKILGIS